MRGVTRGPGPRLAYGTNVLPAADLGAIQASLKGFWRDVRARSAPEASLGLGLWLPDEVARLLAQDPEAMRAMRATLDEAGLKLVTGNAFPARAFHAPVVKEAVYRPAWTEPERFAYTSAVARAVAGIAPAGSDVPVSTLPLGHPKLDQRAQFRAAGTLLASAIELHRLREATGTTVRLALEPEPTCALENVADTVEFFVGSLQPFAAAMGRSAGLAAEAAEEIVRRHLGVCLDLCHAAVEHEDPVEAFELLRGAGVPIFKVQVSAAVEVPDPADPAQRVALARFVEPRWLHQVGAPPAPDLRGARVARDLPDALAHPTLAAHRPWRVHFHVPLHEASAGGLPTTRPLVERFLAHVAALDDPPVLEVETYTWSVVPGAPPDLAANIAAELAWVREALLGARSRE